MPRSIYISFFKLLFISVILILPVGVLSSIYEQGDEFRNMPAMINDLGIPSGWSDDTRLTYSPQNSVAGDLVANQNKIFLVWMDFKSGVYEVYFKKSENYGRNWSEDVKISEYTPSPFCEPKIAVNGSSIHVVWEGLDLTREVHYRRSIDGGMTWMPEISLTADDGKWSFLPLIAVYNDNIHVIWTDHRNSDQPDVYYINSTDGGLNWNSEHRLTNNLITETAVDITANNSNIYLTWARLLTRNEIFFLHSSNGGISWESEVQLTADDGIHSVPESIAVWQQSIHLAYRELSEVFYISSYNGGNTWNPSFRISDLPDYSTQAEIAVEKSNVTIVWADTRDYYGTIGTPTELYYSISNDGGITWNNDIRLTIAENVSTEPAIAMGDDRIHVIWTDNRETSSTGYEIYYKRFPDFDATAIEIVDTSPSSVKPVIPFAISCTATDNQTLNASMVSLYYEDVTGARFGPIVASSFTTIGYVQVTKAGDDDDSPKDTRSYGWSIPAQSTSGEIHYWFATNDGSGNTGTFPVGANWAGPYNTILVQNVANMDQPHPAIGFVKNPLNVGINGATVQATWYNAGEGAYFTINGLTGNDGLGRPGWYQIDIYQNNWTIGNPLWVNATVTYAGSPYAGQNFTLLSSGDNIIPDDNKEYVNITLQIQEFFELKWTLGWNIWSHPMIRSENVSLGLADLPFRWFANEHWKDTSQVGAGDECTLVAYVAGAYVTYIYPLDNGTVNDVTVTPDLAYWAFVGESWFTDEVALALPEQGILVPGQYIWRYAPVRTVSVDAGWNLLGWTSFNATFSATDVIMTLTTGAVSPDGVPQPEIIANWTAANWETGNTMDMVHWEGNKDYTTFVWLGVYGQSTAVYDFSVGPGYGFWVYSEVGGQTLVYLTS